MKIWFDVQQAGTTTGPGPVVEIVEFSKRARLNQAGDWTATVALDDRALDLLQPRRTVLAYAMVENARTFIGGGTIENLRVRVDGGASMLEISGRDLLEELNRSSVGDVFVRSGTDFDLADFVVLNMPAAWAAGPILGDTPPLEAHFMHESFLGSLTAIADKLPFWFRMAGARQLAMFGGALPTTIALRCMANVDPVAAEANAEICLIASVTEERQAADILTRIIGFGAGNAEARMTLAAATLWPDGSPVTAGYTTEDGDALTFDAVTNTITNTSAESAYGRIERALAWREIAPISNTNADVEAAANMLVVVAVEQLRRSRAPIYLYSLDVAAVRRSVLPGDLVHVTARQMRDGQTPINIDRALRVLEVRTSIDADGIRVDGLTVASADYWPPTDDQVLVAEVRQAQVLSALPQTGPSVDTISYREPIDDDYEADFRFWLGAETTSINQVLIRFRVDPFRSTAKTVGGTVTGFVDIPDHTHTVTVMAHSHGVPNHQHKLKIIGNGAGALTYDIGFGAGGTSGSVRHNIDSSDWEWPTTSDSGSTTTVTDGGSTPTSSDGGGQTGLELDISAALSLVYGIYEDSSINTYLATDLEWLVNGALVAETPTGTDGGWYELDITAYVSDARYRPFQPTNVATARVQASRKDGKLCQVTAQIQSRCAIQAIDYS